MNPDTLNTHKGMQTDAISLDGFIVKETVAIGPLMHTHGRLAAKNNFGPADLRNIQKRRRRASGRLYNRYL